jgi:hypothetical protein
MLTRSLEAGVPAAWVTGDEVYSVVAAGDPYRADALLRRVPARAWQCISAGKGAKGHRHDDRAFIRLDGGEQGAEHWLLVRRHQRTGEPAFYRCFMPHPVPRPPWPESPGGAGPSRSASRPAKPLWPQHRARACHHRRQASQP